MKLLFTYLLSQSILIPIIIGLIRLRRLKGYQPFFILLIIGTLTETAGYITIKRYGTNLVVVNIYVVLEWIFIAWQFHVWGLLRQKKWLYYLLLTGPILLWIEEDLVLGNITRIEPYFRFLYFLLIVLLSINKINFTITHESRNLLRNPQFILCLGFIIYFMYMIVYFWAYYASVFERSVITSNIIGFMAYVNVLTNIIFGIALWMIPAPQKFTLR
ncbi:hypothetical protein Q4E93_25140 [Flavitalea sp. BT771]|uniref:hypothetical protein n=1 Tax=Flavitalea sp. BT771 TaxID=3063329 RepID=UPI0026E134B9|nr:hypothetical protein [Flavitalea sp. BT771]MDO6433917.1 hypothetical protein [Flavitalea sp. BT771]MDV6222178.1 hypothetical protein [Flavitalea sp. BT771]